MPVNDAVTIFHLIDYHSKNNDPNKVLNKLIEYYLSKIISLENTLTLTSNHGPVQFLTIGDAPSTLAIEKTLLNNGLQVKAIRPPTVLAGHAGLRISLHAYNTSEEIDLLFRSLKTIN